MRILVGKKRKNRIQDYKRREVQLKDMWDMEREKYLIEIGQLRSQLDAWNCYRRLRSQVAEIEKVVNAASPDATGWYIRTEVNRVLSQIREGEI